MFRAGASDFTRGGPLRPEILVALLLFQAADAGRHGYRDLLADFWDDARSRGIALPDPVSAPAYCLARRKLDPAAVRRLLHEVCDSFDRAHGRRFRWKGRRLLAADGTSLQLQRSDELEREFGRHGGAHRPSVHVTTLYDVLSGLPLDAVGGPATETDRSALWELLRRVRPGDVLLLDRGFPSYDLFAWLLSERIDFVVRVPADRANAVAAFVESGSEDAPVVLRSNQFAELRDGPPISLRAVRGDSPTADQVILLTSLDATVADAAEVAGLYRRRWAIEEHYKLIQSPHLGPGFFHSRSVAGVFQEIYAQALLLAITRHLAAGAARLCRVPFETVSTKGALLSVASHLTAIALGSLDAEDVVRLLERIAASRIPKRPGRSYPRRSFTPQRLWGPNGRRRRPEHRRLA